MTHTSEHDRILQAITAGELSLDSPEVVSLLEECARCRKEIEEVSSLKLDLDRTGELRQRTLESAERQKDAVPSYHAKTVRAFFSGEELPVDEDDLRSIAALPSEPPAAAPASRRVFGGRMLSAAAAVLLLIAGAWIGGVFDRDPPIIMGGSIENLSPQGEGADFNLFRWDHAEATDSGYYRVLIWPEGLPAIETSLPITEPTWVPDLEQSATWSAIEWQVVYLEGGEEIARSKRVKALSR